MSLTQDDDIDEVYPADTAKVKEESHARTDLLETSHLGFEAQILRLTELVSSPSILDKNLIEPFILPVAVQLLRTQSNSTLHSGSSQQENLL